MAITSTRSNLGGSHGVFKSMVVVLVVMSWGTVAAGHRACEWSRRDGGPARERGRRGPRTREAVQTDLDPPGCGGGGFRGLQCKHRAAFPVHRGSPASTDSRPSRSSTVGHARGRRAVTFSVDVNSGILRDSSRGAQNDAPCQPRDILHTRCSFCNPGALAAVLPPPERSRNRLTGQLPATMACADALAFVDVSANLLTEPSPACMRGNSSARTVLVAGNCFADAKQQRAILQIPNSGALVSHGDGEPSNQRPEWSRRCSRLPLEAMIFSSTLLSHSSCWVPPATMGPTRDACNSCRNLACPFGGLHAGGRCTMSVLNCLYSSPPPLPFSCSLKFFRSSLFSHNSYMVCPVTTPICVDQMTLSPPGYRHQASSSIAGDEFFTHPSVVRCSFIDGSVVPPTIVA